MDSTPTLTPRIEPTISYSVTMKCQTIVAFDLAIATMSSADALAWLLDQPLDTADQRAR